MYIYYKSIYIISYITILKIMSLSINDHQTLRTTFRKVNKSLICKHVHFEIDIHKVCYIILFYC